MADRRQERMRQSSGDLVRSLALVLVVVAVVAVLTVRNQPETPLREVQVSDAVVRAEELAEFPVLRPEGLPGGWRATSARAQRVSGSVGPVSWEVGYVTPEDLFAGFEQSDAPRKDVVERSADAAEPAGPASLDGVTWARLTGGDPEPRALVRAEDGVTTVVAGNASWAEIEQLARSLAAG